MLAGCVEFNLAKLDRWHAIETQCWENYGLMEGDVRELLPLLQILRERAEAAGHRLITADEKTYTGQLRTLLNWGHKMGMVPVVPAFEPMAQSQSKGRLVTAEEFDRMEAATVKVVGPVAAPSWRRLRLSGLRIGEAVALSREADAPFRVDLSGRHPLLRIAGEAQKNRKDQTCPITPEFAGFLLATPEHDRRGRVFRPMRKDGDDSPMREDTASKVLCAVGEKAGVVVARKPSGKVKFGSAHDLRRSFGFRWAKKVMPAVLMELMRHSSICTTMRYYATKNAESTAEMLWAEHAAGANVFTNTQSEAADTEEARNDVSRDSVTA